MAAEVDIVIRDAAPDDETAWRRLWTGYLVFYNTPVPEAVTANTWARILDPDAPVFARLALRHGAALGFSISVLHPSTWTLNESCYLEDLFVAKEARGHGLGRALLDDLLGLAEKNGWDRLYWHTQANNAAARRLYDRYTHADGFVRYRVTLKK